ncbi:MAG: hypothetical protein JSS68_09220 [Actinobacteria bacterium]|nr:hypothetical protein [Actinomycetota bacterium]MBS1883519.1 hypothetical protein [Actinomycetota bacterium]
MSEQGAAAIGPLFKTTIVIWSEYPGEEVELEHLARDATGGEAYCPGYRSEPVRIPGGDADWDGTDFFAKGGN